MDLQRKQKGKKCTPDSVWKKWQNAKTGHWFKFRSFVPRNMCSDFANIISKANSWTCL